MLAKILGAIQTELDNDSLSEERAQELLNQFMPFIGLQPPLGIVTLLGGMDNFIEVEDKAKELLAKIETEFPDLECQCDIEPEFEVRSD